MTHRKNIIDRRLCVAPMMEWTDRHCRYFLRQVAPDALLFTEMVTAAALIHGNLDRLLDHDAAEAPLVLQLGDSQPDRLARAVALAAPWTFAEINLNVGCPSDRVQSGKFGACLMAEPELVASCCRAMMDETDVPVTVKCRIGIDDMDPQTGLDRFVDAVADAGAQVIYLHARKAWLNGLSPKENREIPPLDYGRAERLARRRPDLDIILNGGLTDRDMTSAMLQPVGQIFAGVMLGRAAYKTPYQLGLFHQILHNKTAPIDLVDIALKMTDYAEQQIKTGVPLQAITRHMLGLCAGLKGARAFRRELGEQARMPGADWTLIETALKACLRENKNPDEKKVA